MPPSIGRWCSLVRKWPDGRNCNSSLRRSGRRTSSRRRAAWDRVEPTWRQRCTTLRRRRNAITRVESETSMPVLRTGSPNSSELVENVRGIAVDVDDKRQLLSIVMTDLQNTEHVASALSDGTLRFLALTVMESDPRSRRLLCLEEPENGMHPLRILAVIELLGELAVDVEEPVDADNPLRQVIINTHSPSVVACVHDDALLVAHAGRGRESEASRLSIRHLPHTWRDQEDSDEPTATRGDLLAYLNPLQAINHNDDGPRVGATRVMHRTDLSLTCRLRPSKQSLHDDTAGDTGNRRDVRRGAGTSSSVADEATDAEGLRSQAGGSQGIPGEASESDREAGCRDSRIPVPIALRAPRCGETGAVGSI